MTNEKELRILCGNAFVNKVMAAKDRFLRLEGMLNMKGPFPMLGVSEEDRFEAAAQETRMYDIRFHGHKKHWTSLDVCLHFTNNSNVFKHTCLLRGV